MSTPTAIDTALLYLHQAATALERTSPDEAAVKDAKKAAAKAAKILGHALGLMAEDVNTVALEPADLGTPLFDKASL